LRAPSIRAKRRKPFPVLPVDAAYRQGVGRLLRLRKHPLAGRGVAYSMGPIFDRSTEHLGSADAMVIQVRRRLLNAVKARVERGLTPSGVDNPDVYRVRSGGVFLPVGADWVEDTRDLRKAFVEHTELD